MALHVVATPIGNMQDITARAARVLAGVHAIFAEDTRRTAQLLAHLEIERPRGGLISCHDHNESARVAQVLKLLERGHDLALVSDAGTPGISDPGYRIVRAAHEAGHEVTPVPGPCAATAALSASGLPSDRFTFAGFPPKKAGARRRFLEEVADAPGTLILYAAAREVEAIVEDLLVLRRGAEVVIFRELTKRFEQCVRGAAEEVLTRWRSGTQKGEVTLLVGPAVAREVTDEDLLALLRVGKSPAEVAESTGVSKRRAYQLKLTLK